MGVKGQKINPVGWRLGFYRKWKSNWFAESWNYGLMLNKILKINEIIESFLLYKRFAALNCNSLVLNTGLNKFNIIVFFYNLRVEETAFIKKERKKLKFQDKFKTLYKLWHFEKNQVKKNFVHKKSEFFTSSIILKSQKNKVRKKLLKEQSKVGNNKKKPLRLLYKEIFFKNQSTTFKKVSKLNWVENNFDPFFFKSFINTSAIKKFLGLSNLFSIFILNYMMFEKRIFYTFDSILMFCSRKLKFLLSFIYLYFISFTYLRFHMNNGLKQKWNISVMMNNLLTNINLNEQFNMLSINNYYTKSFFLLKNKKTQIKKPYLQVLKYFIIDCKRNNFDLMNSFTKESNKNTSRKLRINYQKLSQIKFIALGRKFKRWNNKNQLVLWKRFINPTLRSFQQYHYKLFKKHQVFDIFLRKLSHYLYLKKIHNINITKNINNDNDKSKNKNFKFLYKKNLRWKSSLIQKNKFFKLNDLKLSLENILQNKVDIFFINSLSILRFQSKFLWVRTQQSVRKLGFNLLWQGIRLNKINVNRQGRSLLRQPFFIERRNKRLGPLLQDFVLLVLIALITRNFKVLLKFINNQTQMLSKSKRQIPFIRLLIRLISNLGGSLIKIKGLRIQFKGRFDRWNRTKSIIYTSGSIPFQRKDIDLEYASSHGQVQKGIYGIRLWVWYGNNYHQRYKDLFTSFWYKTLK